MSVFTLGSDWAARGATVLVSLALLQPAFANADAAPRPAVPPAGAGDPNANAEPETIVPALLLPHEPEGVFLDADRRGLAWGTDGEYLPWLVRFDLARREIGPVLVPRDVIAHAVLAGDRIVYRAAETGAVVVLGSDDRTESARKLGIADGMTLRAIDAARIAVERTHHQNPRALILRTADLAPVADDPLLQTDGSGIAFAAPLALPANPSGGGWFVGGARRPTLDAPATTLAGPTDPWQRSLEGTRVQAADRVVAVLRGIAPKAAPTREDTPDRIVLDAAPGAAVLGTPRGWGGQTRGAELGSMAKTKLSLFCLLDGAQVTTLLLDGIPPGTGRNQQPYRSLLERGSALVAVVGRALFEIDDIAARIPSCQPPLAIDLAALPPVIVVGAPTVVPLTVIGNDGSARFTIGECDASACAIDPVSGVITIDGARLVANAAAKLARALTSGRQDGPPRERAQAAALVDAARAEARKNGPARHFRGVTGRDPLGWVEWGRLVVTAADALNQPAVAYGAFWIEIPDERLIEAILELGRTTKGS